MNNSNRENLSLNEKILEHKELIAALVSGFIILLAWRMESTEQTTAAVIAYLTAFLSVAMQKQKKVLKIQLKISL